MGLDNEQLEEFEKRVHRSASFQRMFQGADGKLFLDEIDKMAGYKNDTFDPDPYISSYRAGQRSVAIFMHNVIEQDINKANKLLEKDKRDG